MDSDGTNVCGHFYKESSRSIVRDAYFGVLRNGQVFIELAESVSRGELLASAYKMLTRHLEDWKITR